MRYRFLTADVFTDRPFGGNPLAVFPVRSRDALGRSRLRLDLWESMLAGAWAPHDRANNSATAATTVF